MRDEGLVKQQGQTAEVQSVCFSFFCEGTHQNGTQTTNDQPTQPSTNQRTTSLQLKEYS